MLLFNTLIAVVVIWFNEGTPSGDLSLAYSKGKCPGANIPKQLIKGKIFNECEYNYMVHKKWKTNINLKQQIPQ